MATFQVVALKPYAGISKQSQRPYNMLVVKGVFTSDDGVVDTAEVVFMEGQNKKLPSLVVGQKYEPVISLYVNRDGKLASSIEELKLIKNESVRAAA